MLPLSVPLPCQVFVAVQVFQKVEAEAQEVQVGFVFVLVMPLSAREVAKISVFLSLAPSLQLKTDSATDPDAPRVSQTISNVATA